MNVAAIYVDHAITIEKKCAAHSKADATRDRTSSMNEQPRSTWRQT